MDYIKQLLKEKEAEIEELTNDLESLMVENIQLREELSTTQKVLASYHTGILKKDLKIQSLKDNSAEWLSSYKEV